MKYAAPATYRTFSQTILQRSTAGSPFSTSLRDQPPAFKAIRPDLPRSHISRSSRHLRQRNDPLALHVDLIPPAVGKAAIGGRQFFFRRGMSRIGPCITVEISYSERTCNLRAATLATPWRAVRKQKMGEWCRLSGSLPSTPASPCLRVDYGLPIPSDQKSRRRTTRVGSERMRKVA